MPHLATLKQQTFYGESKQCSATRVQLGAMKQTTWQTTCNDVFTKDLSHFVSLCPHYICFRQCDEMTWKCIGPGLVKEIKTSPWVKIGEESDGRQIFPSWGGKLECKSEDQDQLGQRFCSIEKPLIIPCGVVLVHNPLWLLKILCQYLWANDWIWDQSPSRFVSVGNCTVHPPCHRVGRPGSSRRGIRPGASLSCLSGGYLWSAGDWLLQAEGSCGK